METVKLEDARDDRMGGFEAWLFLVKCRVMITDWNGSACWEM